MERNINLGNVLFLALRKRTDWGCVRLKMRKNLDVRGVGYLELDENVILK
jgi:hypothetical protein